MVPLKYKQIYIKRLTEERLRAEIEATRERGQIDIKNAKIFIFPYKSIEFYISDIFLQELSGRLDHRNPHCWFSIPCCDSFDYSLIRATCREFAESHPFEGNFCLTEDDQKFEIPHICLFDFSEQFGVQSSEVTCRRYSKDFILPTSFVAIDFETFYPQRLSACSVGMVKYKNGVIIDRYSSLIRPPFDYLGKCGKALTWIHGFTEEMLMNERTMQKVLPEMESFAAKLPLVAHNACVEKACINETAKFYGLKIHFNLQNMIDTFPLSLKIEQSLGMHFKGPRQHSLDAVCNRFGVPILHHHNALDDAEMCGNLILAFQKVLDSDSIVFPAKRNESKKDTKYRVDDRIPRIDIDNICDNPFKSCCIVLTGFSTAISQEYGHILFELGAQLSTNVSNKTKWLVCGPNAGPSKLYKAQQIGAQIINETQFLEIISKYHD